MVDLFESLIIIAPELILAIIAMSLLMIGSFYQKKSINLIIALSFLTLLILSFNELISKVGHSQGKNKPPSFDKPWNKISKKDNLRLLFLVLKYFI